MTSCRLCSLNRLCDKSAGNTYFKTTSNVEAEAAVSIARTFPKHLNTCHCYFCDGLPIISMICSIGGPITQISQQASSSTSFCPGRVVAAGHLSLPSLLSSLLFLLEMMSDISSLYRAVFAGHCASCCSASAHVGKTAVLQ